MWVLDQCKDVKSIALIGMSKNAGKTTVMNTLLNLLNKHTSERVAITSIGLDGEEQDTLSLKHKPRITVYKDMWVATAEQALIEHPVALKNQTKLDIATAMGAMVVGQVKKQSTILLAGPSKNKDLIKLKAFFETTLTVDRFIIDGALFRKSFAKSSLVDGVILVSGAVYSRSLKTVVKDTMSVIEQLSLKPKKIKPKDALAKVALYHQKKEVYSSRHPLSLHLNQVDGWSDLTFDTVYINGALTNQVVSKLLEHRDNLVGKTLIIDTAAHILCDAMYYRYLITIGLKLFVRDSVNLLFLAINPFSPSGYQFDNQAMHQAFKASNYNKVINVLTDLELVT